MDEKKIREAIERIRKIEMRTMQHYAHFRGKREKEVIITIMSMHL